MDRVVLNQQFSNIEISDETKSFFVSNGISLDSHYFDMDLLRSLFRENKNLFYHILNELSLYGCDFYSSKNNSFFPEHLGEDFKKIHSSSSEPISTAELNELKLWKLFSEYGKKSKSSLNGISVQRLNEFVGGGINKDSLVKCGYEIVDNKIKQSVLIEKTNNLIIPKFFAKYVTTLWTCDQHLLDAFRSYGVMAYRDLLNINESNIEKLVTIIMASVKDVYEAGVYCFNLCTFVKEKGEFAEALSKTNLTLESLIDEETVINSYDLETIRDYVLFDLRNFDYNVSQFNQINEATGFLYTPNTVFAYLKYFGVEDLISLRENIYTSDIGFYRFSELKESTISYQYNPFVILDYLNQEINGVAVEDESVLDFEFRKIHVDYTMSDFFPILEGLYSSQSKLKMVLDIMTMRDSGETLDTIGKKYKITRERIRQIGKKHLDRAKKHYNAFVGNLFENKAFYSISQLKKITGLLEFLYSGFNETGIVVNDRLGIVLREEYSKRVDEYIKNNSKQIGFNIFNSQTKILNETLIFTGLFLTESRDVVYDPFPSFTTIKKASAIDVAYIYLGTKGIKGFDARKDIDEARAFFAQYEPDVANASDRAIIGRVQRVDYVSVGMSRYARTDFISDEIKEAARQVLDEYPINKQYGTVAKEIYAKNKERLEEAGIDNDYFLYGIGSKWKLCGYTYAGRSMRIFVGKEISLNKIVFRYISANGPIVKSKKMCEDLGMREVGFDQISFVSKYDPDSFILTSFVQCTQSQANKIFAFIDKNIKQNGYCLAKEILDGELFYDSTFNTFFMANKIGNSPSRLTYALEIIALRMGYKKYNFSHVIHAISLKTKPINTTAEVVHEHFQDNEFSRNDLFDFLDEVELAGEVTRKEFLKNYVVRVGNDRYVVSKEYTLDAKEIAMINEHLNSYFEEDLCITATEAMTKLQLHGIKHSFAHNPVGFCSAISFYEKSDWIRPRNNVNYDNTRISVLLANKKIFTGITDITISDVIYRTIMSINKAYMSYNDISDYLLNNEITSSALPFDIFKQIFGNDIADNGLVRIKK